MPIRPTSRTSSGSHRQSVHGVQTPPDYTANPDKLWEGTYLRSEATYFGPAYMINWLHNDLGPDITVEVALINCHYP